MLEGFEWDSEKAEENLRKHGVSFYEAATAVLDDLAFVKADDAHSEGEYRYVLVGRSHRGRTLVVVLVERQERIRIISARRATRAEKKSYEQGE